MASVVSWSSPAAAAATLCIRTCMLCAIEKKEEEGDNGKMVFPQPFHDLTGQ